MLPRIPTYVTKGTHVLYIGYSPVTKDTHLCYQGYQPVLPRVPTYVTKGTNLCYQGYTPVTKDTHLCYQGYPPVTKDTHLCYQGYPPMLTRVLTHVTKGAHLCYQGYQPMLPRAPTRAYPLQCLAFYFDRYGDSQLVRAVIHVENDSSDRQLIEAATRVEITFRIRTIAFTHYMYIVVK